MDEEITVFGKTYQMEKPNLFVEMFRKWQKRFICPKCKTPTMDFILRENIEAPLICTKCHTLFNFNVKQNDEAVN